MKKKACLNSEAKTLNT